MAACAATAIQSESTRKPPPLPRVPSRFSMRFPHAGMLRRLDSFVAWTDRELGSRDQCPYDAILVPAARRQP